MKEILSIILSILSINLLHAQSSEFNQPWTGENSVIVIDAFSGNDIDWNKMKTDKKMVGVIHRTSKGMVADIKYLARKNKALLEGYLFGSYHLGLAGDAVKQADFYLKTVGDTQNVLLSLDLEIIDTAHMSLSNAEVFVNRIFEKTGRFPFIYCNRDVLLQINSKYDSSSVFAKCGLWYARFRKDIPTFDSKVWNTYSLWQFSSEINCTKTGTCLYNVPGTAFDMDVNVFNGNKEALKAVWTK